MSERTAALDKAVKLIESGNVASHLTWSMQMHFQGKLSEATANLQNYLTNPAGIGEHPNVVEECIKPVEQVHDANGCLEILSHSKQS